VESGPASTLSVLSAEATVGLRDGRVAQRELLRVEGERRFELRPAAAEGLVLVDLGPGVLNASIVAKVRSTLEIEFVVLGLGEVPLDLWCTCLPAANSQASLTDAHGRLVVPDIAARDPAMGPIIASPGRYLLDVQVWEGTCVLRLAQSMQTKSVRAAV
jgi:hypothetical protein